MDTVSALTLVIVPIVLIVWLARALDSRRYDRGIGEPPASGNKIFLIVIVGIGVVIYIIFRFLNGGLDAIQSDIDYAHIVIAILFLILLGLLAFQHLRKRIQ